LLETCELLQPLSQRNSTLNPKASANPSALFGVEDSEMGVAGSRDAAAATSRASRGVSLVPEPSPDKILAEMRTEVGMAFKTEWC
jgi:hypothetical protein